MSELRYAFGQNWQEFIDKHLSESVIAASVQHLRHFMRTDSFEGKTFLDIGCGSGVHSLAAIRLGAAKVVSFDYDQKSVLTSQKVRAWANIPEDRWTIFQGSALDTDLLSSLGKFDIVYSWGVLHHTGAMWDAVRNTLKCVKDDGQYYIALYSSDNYTDPTPEFWIRLKRAYNQANSLTRKLMELKYVYWTLIRSSIEEGGEPLARFSGYDANRGMTAWVDARDWIGGYPMEFSGYAETRDFCEGQSKLKLVNSITGRGCTEYLFANTEKSSVWTSIEGSRKRTEMNGPFDHAGSSAYVFRVPRLENQADCNENQLRSQVMIYEDGKPLGISHSKHQDIRELGGGRFSHWGSELIFSASDNSDPNTNGRSYSYCDNY